MAGFTYKCLQKMYPTPTDRHFRTQIQGIELLVGHLPTLQRTPFPYLSLLPTQRVSSISSMTDAVSKKNFALNFCHPDASYHECLCCPQCVTLGFFCGSLSRPITFERKKLICKHTSKSQSDYITHTNMHTNIFKMYGIVLHFKSTSFVRLLLRLSPSKTLLRGFQRSPQRQDEHRRQQTTNVYDGFQQCAEACAHFK
jgi:hypothetical protein